MFGRYFRARFAGSKQNVLKTGKGADVKLCALKLVYDFSPELAEALGPRAVSMQGQLQESNEAQLTAKSITVDLDCKTVMARLKHGNSIVLKVGRTRAIRAVAKAPTAQNATPSLVVHLISDLSYSQLDFVSDYLNEGVTVRLDRKAANDEDQLDLVAEPDADADGED
jgi:hypothetical protein